MLRAERLVPAEAMEAARRLVLGLDGQRSSGASVEHGFPLDRDEDSVDGSPTFECRWVAEGQYTHAGLAAIFQPFVEERLLPLLRRSPLGSLPGGGGELVLCEALVRMYDEGARRVHPAHYDADALVTAVLELDTCAEAAGSGAVSGGRGFSGPGFYVQPGAHVSTRLPIAMAPGDVVAHSFDLQHGVHVTGGRRCSVIFWFTDSAASCSDKSRPWYAAAAA